MIKKGNSCRVVSYRTHYPALSLWSSTVPFTSLSTYKDNKIVLKKSPEQLVILWAIICVGARHSFYRNAVWLRPWAVRWPHSLTPRLTCIEKRTHYNYYPNGVLQTSQLPGSTLTHRIYSCCVRSFLDLGYIPEWHFSTSLRETNPDSLLCFTNNPTLSLPPIILHTSSKHTQDSGCLSLNVWSCNNSIDVVLPELQDNAPPLSFRQVKNSNIRISHHLAENHTHFLKCLM